MPRPLSKHSFVANWKGRSFLCITFIMSIYWINKLIMTYKRTQTAQGIMLILSLKDVIAWWTRPPTLFVDIRSMLTTQKPELRINREVFCLFWTISVAFYTRQKGTRPINFCFVCTQLRIVFNFLFHHLVTRVNFFCYNDKIMLYHSETPDNNQKDIPGTKAP